MARGQSANAAKAPRAPHGTVKRYAQGCPCPRCSDAAAFYQEWWDESDRADASERLHQRRLDIERRRTG